MKLSRLVGESERRGALAPYVLFAGLAWFLLTLGSGSIAIPTICSAELLWSLPSPASYASVFVFVSPMQLSIGWAAMVVAMMLPTAVVPLIYIHERSFRHLRCWTMLLFACGYFAVWMLAGVILVGAALTIRMSASSETWAAIVFSAVMCIWQTSPWKQVALNKCHVFPVSSAFAPAAYTKAVSSGLRHGAWCIISCWSLMLAALLVPVQHLPVMVVVAIWIWAERLEQPRKVAWNWHLPINFFRLIVSLFRRCVGRRAGNLS